MGQALYRKYRSRSLDEIIGQEHITRTLKQALKQGRISHAYLFTGPRGVGKTSVARILAHEINGLPYNGDDSHLDIIEIDAASNRRIDEIRELRDKVYVAPASAKYKVYIIDEVHMLTREAFNALLKTLEEPPAHAVFILATTDAHKLPETIVSRTQRFAFKPVETDLIVAHLKDIAKTEKIKISDEAARLLAEHGEGSFRDSISLLDQAGNHADKIEVADVQRLLGMPPAEAVDNLLSAATNAATQTADLMRAITALYDQGYQAAAIAKQLGRAARGELMAGSLDPDLAFGLLRDLIEVPASHDPERFLEIALLRAVPRTNIKPQEPAAAKETPAPDKTTAPKEPPTPAPAKDKPEAPPKTKPSAKRQTLDAAIWPDVLKAVKQQHNTLYSIVRMAEPDFSEGGTVKLTFAFAFHKKRIDENANRQKMADIIQELTGQAVKIECQHDKNAAPPASAATETEAPDPSDPNLTAISNIFGNAELLES
ncbi:MAG TPA: DNA polymerase III subunit gamma/tau [Candidatus Dormibacteraeota bacterium]|nr:DNA polymerase III subunit gamma/tau [Candidatus Dormibacteraeota bacterium]